MATPPRRRPAFTLIELMGVVAIVGLLMIFILVAASNAQEEAKQAATRSLIAKLDAGMNSLMESIYNARVNATPIHHQWAGVYNANNSGVLVGSLNDRAVAQRAQVIATYDQVRANVPDTFFVQDRSLGYTSYPFNFAQQSFVSNTGQTWADYVLPIGFNWGAASPGPGTGIFGASYAAAAGLLKNLGNLPPALYPNAQGLLPQGYDGADNDFGSTDQWGLIDNLHEGIQGNAAIQTSVAQALGAHKHITARAEMLYALLVEGQGQFGAIFNRDDFAPNQVGDTDSDGLPEFIDAWGNPLQFFRWPIYYPSDVQKGFPTIAGSPSAPYPSVLVPREVDPLDPNQQLTSVPWWSSGSNNGPAHGLLSANATNPVNNSFMPSQQFLSGGAVSFQKYFHSLVEPLSYAGSNANQFWDRSTNFYPRRAFYTRFLILSSGPDGIPGVPILDDNHLANLQSSGGVSSVSLALQLESQAAPYDLQSRLNSPNWVNDFTTTNHPITINQTAGDGFGQSFVDLGLDDITNHNLNATSGSPQ